MLELSDTVNGKQSQDDIILVKYLDQSDNAGEQSSSTVKPSKTFAKVETAGGGSRIGHEFTLRIYEPDGKPIHIRDKSGISIDQLHQILTRKSFSMAGLDRKVFNYIVK